MQVLLRKGVAGGLHEFPRVDTRSYPRRKYVAPHHTNRTKSTQLLNPDAMGDISPDHLCVERFTISSSQVLSTSSGLAGCGIVISCT